MVIIKKRIRSNTKFKPGARVKSNPSLTILLKFNVEFSNKILGNGKFGFASVI